jgi:hypothetical protein
VTSVVLVALVLLVALVEGDGEAIRQLSGPEDTMPIPTDKYWGRVDTIAEVLQARFGGDSYVLQRAAERLVDNPHWFDDVMAANSLDDLAA